MGVMPSSLIGTPQLSQAYGTLSNLLSPASSISNLTTSGLMDPLASQLQTGQEAGLADIARRGVTTTGAVPELETGLQSRYAAASSAATGQGAQAESQRQNAVLNAMLGIGQDTASQLAALSSGSLAAARGNLISTNQLLEAIAAGTAGLFGQPGMSGSPLGGTAGGLGGMLSQIGAWVGGGPGVATSTPGIASASP